MVRSLEFAPDVTAPGVLRRWAATVLMAASDVLAHLAARIAVNESAAVEPTHVAIEFASVELDGRTVGAVYENGRLVGWLPDIDRL
jgi:hypothetical protein